MSTAKKSILVVDDDKFLIALYQKKFTSEGWEVETALSAVEALQKLRNGLAPSAVVFDIIMPGIDGVEFLKTMHSEKLAANSAKIALTNQSETENVEKIKTLVIDDYIVKASMIPSEVVDEVKKIVEKNNYGV